MSCAPLPFGPCGGIFIRPWSGAFGWLIGLGLFALWVWTLIDVLTRETDENNQRLIWGLVVGFTYVIGAILYLIIRRPERIKNLNR